MLNSLFISALHATEHGRMPDAIVRMGIRNLIGKRARKMLATPAELAQEDVRDFINQCNQSPIALVPDLANAQHYEIPEDFFRHVLGPRHKYSCCYWSEGGNLAAAEDLSLAITCERAELSDGMRILELGCGWGSLSLWMAEHYPRSHIVCVSNSRSQREYIASQCADRGLGNVHVVTADMNDFQPGDQQFDRVVSVEMFEHMRNHQELLRRINRWLFPQGKLFIHLFCHRSTPYLYVDNGPQDWMTKYFFSGGMMPSDHLMLHYQRDLRCLNQWRWSGTHYERTCNAWLSQLDEHREAVLTIMSGTYGEQSSHLWLQRWRIFLMACAELFGYRNGNEWWISHYLFEKPA